MLKPQKLVMWVEGGRMADVERPRRTGLNSSVVAQAATDEEQLLTFSPGGPRIVPSVVVAYAIAQICQVVRAVSHVACYRQQFRGPYQAVGV